MPRRDNIYGYLFKVIAQEAENTWVAFCPGVGGVYEEGETRDEAIDNAYTAACAILEARALNGDRLTEDGPHLRVLRVPPSCKLIGEQPTEDEYVATVTC